jgi:malonyl-ACP decarboxylase
MTSPQVVITGMGTVNAIAGSVPAFADALRAGRTTAVPPRSWQDEAWNAAGRKALRNNTASVRLSACAVREALETSGTPAAAERTGVIVAGNNLHQQYIADNAAGLREQRPVINPRYALCYPDTNQVGTLTDIFAVRGMSYTVGGASASGNVALLHAWHWLRTGVLDACLVVGAATELSPLEQRGFDLIGAASPSGVCRPFDADRDGFVWQMGSACLVLERREAALGRGAAIVGELAGAAMVMDGNSSANPSIDGEARAIAAALDAAGLAPRDVQYVNAHATGSALGDDVECAAIRRAFGEHSGDVWINATKAFTGHCLSAASIVEAIATLIQLNGSFVHANPRLERPIDAHLRFAGTEAVDARCGVAVSNAFAFGGFNTCVVLRTDVR